jgi:hypothetical protein
MDAKNKSVEAIYLQRSKLSKLIKPSTPRFLAAPDWYSECVEQ